jgi:hypothetical protein
MKKERKKPKINKRKEKKNEKKKGTLEGAPGEHVIKEKRKEKKKVN